MPLCNRSHPDRAGLTCDLQEGNHERCTGFVVILGDYEDWPNPAYRPSKREPKGRKGAQERLNSVATRVSAAERLGAPPSASSSRGARREWSEAERQQVWDAVVTVAKRHDEFTAAEIWAELNGAVPVLDDLIKIIRLAMRRGILDSTGKVDEVHPSDPAQDRVIWYSLIQEK